VKCFGHIEVLSYLAVVVLRSSVARQHKSSGKDRSHQSIPHRTLDRVLGLGAQAVFLEADLVEVDTSITDSEAANSLML
jgi:hypothetical protein